MKIENCFYKAGATRAVSFTYDDGRVEDIAIAETLDRYGLKGSFNLNSARIGTKNHITLEQMNEIYKRHEIAGHTVNHDFIINMPPVEVIKEILTDKDNLEKMSGRIVRGFAYPFGNVNEDLKDIVRLCGLEYARGITGNKFIVGDDFFDFGLTCHALDPEVFKKVEEFDNLSKKSWRTLPFLNLFGHSYEYENEGHWQQFDRLCERVSQIENAWFATNIEVCEYITALKNLKRSYDGMMIYNPSAISVWVGVDRRPVEILPGQTVNLKEV